MWWKVDLRATKGFSLLCIHHTILASIQKLLLGFDCTEGPCAACDGTHTNALPRNHSGGKVRSIDVCRGVKRESCTNMRCVAMLVAVLPATKGTCTGLQQLRVVPTLSRTLCPTASFFSAIFPRGGASEVVMSPLRLRAPLGSLLHVSWQP